MSGYGLWIQYCYSSTVQTRRTPWNRVNCAAGGRNLAGSTSFCLQLRRFTWLGARVQKGLKCVRTKQCCCVVVWFAYLHTCLEWCTLSVYLYSSGAGAAHPGGVRYLWSHRNIFVEHQVNQHYLYWCALALELAWEKQMKWDQLHCGWTACSSVRQTSETENSDKKMKESINCLPFCVWVKLF